MSRQTFVNFAVPKAVDFAAPDAGANGATARGLANLETVLVQVCGPELAITVESAHVGDPFVVVSPAHVLTALTTLRDHPDFLCTQLEVIAAVDFLPVAPVPAGEGEAERPAVPGRIEVVYVLFSYRHRHQFTLKVYLSREAPRVDSAASLFRAANWYERECYDMLGIEFVGHPNPRRLLLPTDWVGYPLRKDYVFPEEYNGMKVPL